ncbi:MAG: hypothetical protein LBO71_00830 [Prevotellaceae bacterium]|nr:hypothetical protein [Prevotellaceae bacterium]
MKNEIITPEQQPHSAQTPHWHDKIALKRFGDFLHNSFGKLFTEIVCNTKKFSTFVKRKCAHNFSMLIFKYKHAKIEGAYIFHFMLVPNSD